jgi:hypothetical protein
LLDSITNYFKAFASKVCCYEDLKKYVVELADEDFHKLNEVLGEVSLDSDQVCYSQSESDEIESNGVLDIVELRADSKVDKHGKVEKIDLESWRNQLGI